ncbi:DUF4426 domain-containing protein [Candidatus Halobeggiatoa sp. HSG11]|nr:DUF4426 domain-containing protein [Candidatus Halobeggiatoa sp. HSG11]
MIRKILYLILATLLSSTAYASDDKQIETDDGYIIHYNAFITDFLTAEVARSYNIQRSKKRAMLNVSVRKIGKDKVAQTEAATATVIVKASNLIGQEKNIEIRQIDEKDAIYYIADFTIANQEKIKFELQVTPGDKTQEIKFEQQFFID